MISNLPNICKFKAESNSFAKITESNITRYVDRVLFLSQSIYLLNAKSNLKYERHILQHFWIAGESFWLI